MTELNRGFGAQVHGVDLSRSIAPADADALRKALDTHRLLLFRDQNMEPQNLVDFGRLFGELQSHVRTEWTAQPEVLLVTNKDTIGDGRTVYSDEAARVWHSDGSMLKRTGVATVLYGREVTTQGGQTQVADTSAAYDALSDAMKQKIDGLMAVHDLANGTARVAHLLSLEELRSRQLSAEQRKAYPPVEQPVARTHPATGRKALYVGEAHTSHIVGMPAEESRRLLDELIAHATRPEFVYTHTWKVGDVLIWDNRATLHRGTSYAPGQRRMLWRVTSVGEPAF